MFTTMIKWIASFFKKPEHFCMFHFCGATPYWNQITKIEEAIKNPSQQFYPPTEVLEQWAKDGHTHAHVYLATYCCNCNKCNKTEQFVFLALDKKIDYEDLLKYNPFFLKAGRLYSLNESVNYINRRLGF